MDKMERAKVILQQLGGSRFRAMTGATDFIAAEEGLRFRVPMIKRIVRVDLVDDLYNVEVLTYKGNVKGREGQVYCDNLRGAVERLTGLALSL